MVRGLLLIVLGIACLQAGLAHAAGANECAQLQGKGKGRATELPPPEDVDKLIECAGMERDVKGLDRLDRDLLVMRASYSTLKQWRGKKTDASPPRRYSELAPAQRLKKFKQLVDDYYQRQHAR